MNPISHHKSKEVPVNSYTLHSYHLIKSLQAVPEPQIYFHVFYRASKQPFIKQTCSIHVRCKKVVESDHRVSKSIVNNKE